MTLGCEIRHYAQGRLYATRGFGAQADRAHIPGTMMRSALERDTDTVEGAHCVTADDRDQVYVCDPVHGKILVFKDSLASSK
jgi:hypothetical protein